MIWCGLQIKENYHVFVNQFHGNFHSQTPICRKIISVVRNVKWCFNASWGLKGLNTDIMLGLKFPKSHTFSVTGTAIHNFKWLKIQIEYLSDLRVKSVWASLGVNPPDMPRTLYWASEVKHSQQPTMPSHPTLSSSSVHHSSHQRTALFLSYYNVT